MTVAQGIATQLKRVVQSGLGAPGSSGSQLLRRVSFTMNKTGQTYESAELSSDQMSSGSIEGPTSTSGSLNGEISAGTYDKEWALLLRKDFAACFADIETVALTIAGSGPTYTVTRGTGSFLTDGVKKGHVVRLSVGTLDAANTGKNLLVVGVTGTALTVIPGGDGEMTAEGPISGCTVSAPGKEAHTPQTGHTNKYATYEKWSPDISQSRLFSDVKPNNAAVTIPATGIPTVNFGMVGLVRSPTGAEVCTTPTAETTSEVMESVRCAVVINGAVTAVTNINFTVEGNTATGEPEVGSPTFSDLQRGKISGSGSFAAKFTSATLQTLRDNQTKVTLIFGLFEDVTADAEFVVFTFNAVKIMTDEEDDGDKEIIKTYNWTAGKDRTGGAAAATHYTLCMVHDSLAA